MAKGNAKKGVAVFMILIMTVSLLLGSILILGLLNYAYANKIANIRSDLKIAILNDNAGTEVLALLSDRIEGYRHTEKIGSYLAEGMEDNSGYIAPFKQTLDTAFKKYDFAVSGTNVNFRNGVPQDLQDLTKPAIANCETAPGQDTVSDRISLVWPSESKDISSGFGGRDPSSNGVCSCHPGIDISGGGKRVLAAADGQIVFAGPSGGYGNMVIIEHKFNGKAYYTYYAHLDTIINSSGSVKAGEQIALSGNTGYSTGPHLHFELRKSGNVRLKDSVNPCGFFADKSGVRGNCLHEQVAACSYVAGKDVRGYEIDIPLPGPSPRNSNLKGNVVLKQWE